MGDAEKNEMERVLREGADALADAVRGVDEGKAKRRPRPDGWSVLECVEHVRLVEAGLFSRLKEAQPSEKSHEDPAREARFQGLAMNRLRRIEAPEVATPKVQWRTVAEAVEAFEAVRGETLRWLREFDGDLRSWLTIHPLITRPVNCYEMLLLMALHPKRHAQQIVEIREQIFDARGQIE